MQRHLGAIFSVWLVLAGTAGCIHSGTRTTLSRSFFSDMMHLEDSSSARVSSYNRTGRNADRRSVPPGQTLALADIPGAGCIRHIYFTIGGPQHYLRDLVLRMYWDGETSPSVEVPFGDFFGLGHERVRFFRSLLVTVNTGTGISGTYGFNSYFPMPFADGARLTLSNEGPAPVRAVWYHIDYEKLDALDHNIGRFHAQWRRENPTTPVGEKINVSLHNGVNRDGDENYVILEAKGHGNLVGYFLNVDNLVGGWYGEGDDMIFIDGERWPPSLHGTGTEEIFGGGAGPNSEYAGPYTGFYLVGNRNYAGKVSMYRWFVTDPVRFRKSIRVTVEHGHANNLANDYSSCAFWYQTEPHGPFPPLPPVGERRPRAGTDPHDVAFRKLEELRTKLGEAMVAAREGRLEVDPETARRVTSALNRSVPQAFDNRDFETVIAECSTCISIIEKALEESKAGETR